MCLHTILIPVHSTGNVPRDLVIAQSHVMFRQRRQNSRAGSAVSAGRSVASLPLLPYRGGMPENRGEERRRESEREQEMKQHYDDHYFLPLRAQYQAEDMLPNICRHWQNQPLLTRWRPRAVLSIAMSVAFASAAVADPPVV